MKKKITESMALKSWHSKMAKNIQQWKRVKIKSI